ncbi:MAG TPA: VWA domain-containing protein [Pyrinomonadaceae bacterium]|jgi:VWFA-related protein|nr:VWA domain-containing protein [Pyrinomonadaceae bacterium]
MHYQHFNRSFVLLLLAVVAVCVGFATRTLSANNQQTVASALPSPSPTPRNRDELPQDSDEVIKTETNLTNIFFTAADKNKRFISNLKAEDIRVFEDGQQQDIFTFQTNIDLPLSLAILIDCSASEERTLPDEKEAARAFLENILGPSGKDEAAILSFTGETTLEQGFSGNIERLRRAIDRVEFVPPSGYIGGGVVVNGTPPISGTNQAIAGSTAIWDAVWATSEELIGTSAEHTRRAIILLTDGDDTSSRLKMDEAITAAQKADALIYAIGIGDRYTFNVNEGSLRKIAEKTGGRAYFPRHERDLRDAFAQIQRDLREQYLVAYSPRNKNRDGSYRRIEIQIVNPDLKQQNLKLNYRSGYFAKTAIPETPTKRKSSGQ